MRHTTAPDSARTEASRNSRPLERGIAADGFARDVARSLSQTPRQLPTRYLYDALGSALFDAICELPWYRITHAELDLLATHGRTIFTRARPLSRVVELGPGNGTKLLTLIEAGRYGPDPLWTDGGDDGSEGAIDLHLIDISTKALEQASRTLSGLDGVRIIRHEATYESGLNTIGRRPAPGGRTLTLFLGSNLGNFDRAAGETFLRSIRSALSRGDDLLVGADLVKAEAELLLAYDDPLGVTAAFNRNLLVRINRELGGEFDLDAFDHRAVWNESESRVEMHLVSRRRQRVRIAAAQIDVTIEEGESIWTEASYKYELDELTALVEDAGFRTIERWVSPAEQFALTQVRAV
jgi:dimethylhistidine N-methyltransferase